ncbi:MAG TPA: amidase domain-containing protein [Baekduia sp.]|nr:amidase domain-containing protein [Baekduia sp.]
MTAMLSMALSPVAVAGADPGTTVTGATGSGVPLTISPSADPQVTPGLALDAGARIFVLDGAPKTMTMRRVTIGDLARDSSCTESPDVTLSVYEYPSGGDLSDGTLVAESSEPQPFDADLQQITWLVDPTPLAAGDAYAFVVATSSEDCLTARERSWAHNSSQVNGGARACALMGDGGDGLWRLWHEEGQDESSDCGPLGSVSGLDSAVPTGWAEIDLGLGGASVATGSGLCAVDHGATEAAISGGGVLCQFPQFADAGTDAGADGWYYGLPWSGPDLDGAPRDVYASLEPDVPPTATTDSATDVTRNAATLNATVSAGGSPTSYRFDWGRTTEYGSSAPTGEDGDAGSGDGPVAEPLTGLRPYTTYHYRVSVAHGSADPVLGDDTTFETLGEVPENSGVPTISGSVWDGQKLTAHDGVWAGSRPLKFQYQWQQCDSSGEDCENIDGARRRTYVLSGADVGATLRVVVTASNPGDSVSATSDETAVVTVAPPISASAPVIFGIPAQGELLTAYAGDWTGESPITYEYQWQRCDSDGASCDDIDGATDATYTATDEDVDATVRVVVTATNAADSATRSSAATEVVVVPFLLNTARPALTAQGGLLGDELVVDPGTWSGTGTITYTYQWQRCSSSGTSCTNILGATDATYPIDVADIGSTVRALVVAHNTSGSARATSDPTSTLTAGAPDSVSGPEISGAALEGFELEADPGSWTGTGPLDFAYQWQRCDSGGESCADIDGATDAVYELTSEDLGSTVLVSVLASDSEGSSSATSAVTEVVGSYTELAASVLPSVSGDPIEGETLTVDPGTWDGTGTVSFTYQWQVCDHTGNDCEDIDEADEATYDIDEEDVGSVIRVLVVAADDVDETVVPALAAGPITTADGPTNSVAPALTGTAQVTEELSATSGTWAGTGSITYAYQWQRCDADVRCVDIDGATDSTYTLTGDDAGALIRTAVKATDTLGSTTAATDPTIAVLTAEQENTLEPAITGDSSDLGHVLDAEPGSWSQPASLTYQWRRCDASGTSCADISGATTSSYTLVTADLDATIRVVETATNAAGAFAATSEQTTVVGVSPPANTVLPALSGTVREGETLTTTDGTWTSGGTPTYAYQWQRCDGEGEDCQDIGSAVAATYTLRTADVGSTVRATVTASNGGGPSAESSLPTDVVAASVLQNTAPPTITGTVRDGSLLTGDAGTWTSTPTGILYSYQWRRCDAGGANCTNIDDATDSTYTAQPDDVGGTLRLLVSAQAGWGTRVKTSDQTSVVEALPPSNSVEPVLSGDAIDGQTLSTDNGTWSGTPDLTYSYQWRRCDASGESCSDIADATSADYTLTGDDIASTIRAQVTASNPGGEDSATSAASALVGDAPPTNVGLPTVSGPAIEHHLLSAEQGGWEGTQPQDYSYQWESCDELGEDCTDLSGATDPSYTPVTGDVGQTLRVTVTASNDAGELDATSDPTDVIAAGSPPVNDTAPGIGGYPHDGQQLWADTGSWSGEEEISYQFQWRRCDAYGASCTNISGADTDIYTATSEDVDSTLRVRVTATNPSGEQNADSAPSDVITSVAPINAVPPWIEDLGVAYVGEHETARPGEWSGSAPSTYTYQWQLCDEEGSDCSDISGATDETYTVTSAAIGGTLRVVTTPANATGATPPPPEATHVVGDGGPLNTPSPSITGSARVNSELTVSDGTWSGTTDSFSYEWRRCDSEGESCEPIPGAYGSSYTPTTDDFGHRLTSVVTAHWDEYGVANPASSEPTDVVTSGVPINTEVPTISGTLLHGADLTAGPGTWDGDGPATYTYQWQSCGSSGSFCYAIYGATTQTYRLSLGDVDGRVRVAVTAHHDSDEATAYSAISDVVGETSGGFLPLPTISGEPFVGATLAGDEDFATAGNLYLRWKWQRCDEEGEGCADIDGAAARLYHPTDADVASTLRVAVTRDLSGEGDWYYSSATTAVAAATALENTTEPSLTGQAEIGDSLQADPGEWTGSPDISYDYQWERCDEDGEDCTEITTLPDPNDPTSYDPRRADAGSTIRVVVTATNAWGSASSESEPTQVVADPLPLANTTLPAINGGAWLYAGEPVEWDRGSWDGDPEVTHVWQRCDPLESELTCTDIPDATGDYTPTSADVGYQLRIKETATIPGDSATVYSDPSSDPVNGDLGFQGGAFDGSYSGLAVTGQTITAHSNIGSALDLALATTYTFKRQELDESITVLQDGSDPSYTLTAEDTGLSVWVDMQVTQQRADTATIVDTRESQAILGTIDPEPTNDDPPTTSGDLIAGAELEADLGTWHGGGGTLTYTYQWQRCDSGGDSCEAIDEETATTYRLRSADIASTIRVEVTAHGGPSTGVASSEPTEAIGAATAITNLTAPSISGAETQLETLTADPGTWSGSDPISYSYQWQRCDSSGEDCDEIENGDAITYTLTAEDVGATIRGTVPATNGAGSAPVAPDATAVIDPAPAPVNDDAPTILRLGTNQPDALLAAQHGSWQHVEPDGFTYQWERCESDGIDCNEIDGADEQVYSVSTDDAGSRLQVTVTAKNASGRTSASSEQVPISSEPEASAAGKIVFLDADRSAVYLADEDGENATKVIDCTAFSTPVDAPGQGCTLYHPRISPTGQMIVAEQRLTEWGSSPEAPGRLVTVNYDGSAPRVLGVAGSEPTWTVDALSVTYTKTVEDLESEPQTDLYTLSLAAPGSDPVALVSEPGDQVAADYSPDGALLTFALRTDPEDFGQHGAIYVADAGGGDITPVDLGSAIIKPRDPRFSRDGTQILFGAGSTIGLAGSSQAYRHAQQLYAANADGSSPRQLSRSEDDLQTPAPGARDDLIIATRSKLIVTDFGYGISISYGPPSIWTMAPDGSGAHPLTNDPGNPAAHAIDASAASGIRAHASALKPRVLKSSDTTPDCAAASPCGEWRGSDTAQAVSYALKWANGYNDAVYGTHFSNDCASFVSQALHAGGMAFVREYGQAADAWWMRRARFSSPWALWHGADWTTAFSTVSGFVTTQLAGGRMQDLGQLSAAKWKASDVVVYNWHNGGPRFDHLSIVTRAGADPRVSQHTAARRDVNWRSMRTRYIPATLQSLDGRFMSYQILRPRFRFTNGS